MSSPISLSYSSETGTTDERVGLCHGFAVANTHENTTCPFCVTDCVEVETYAPEFDKQKNAFMMVPYYEQVTGLCWKCWQDFYTTPEIPIVLNESDTKYYVQMAKNFERMLLYVKNSNSK